MHTHTHVHVYWYDLNVHTGHAVVSAVAIYITQTVTPCMLALHPMLLRAKP